MQIQDEVLHSLTLERENRIPKFIHRGLCKPADLDVPNLFVHHVGGVNAVDGDFVPGDVKRQQLRFAFSLDANLNHRAFGAFEKFHDIAVGDANARSVLTIDFNDAVAGADAKPFRGASTDGGDDHDGVLEDVELHPDAVKVAVERFVRFLEFFRREVDRVRVEIFQHFHHRPFGQILDADAVDIELSDVAHEGTKLLGCLLRRHVVLGQGP